MISLLKYNLLDAKKHIIYSRNHENSIDLIKQFGKLLKHIHMHDNLGGDSEKHDIHLPIGGGTLILNQFLRNLKKSIILGILLLNYTSLILNLEN